MFESGYIDKIFYRYGNISETVNELVCQIALILPVFNGGNFLIDINSHFGAFDIALGNKSIDGKVDKALGLFGVGGNFALLLKHCVI